MNWEKMTSVESTSLQQAQGRDLFQRDHDRLLFSSDFRSLNQKTQVFPMPGSCFVHNRMTHSIETSCVGRSLGEMVGGVVAQLRDLNNPYAFQIRMGRITETACLAHDIGNPPFGHSGEAAISSFFETNPDTLSDLTEKQKADLLNFEGNAQGFRLLTRTRGELDLTPQVLAAFIKYPRESLVNDYKDPLSVRRKDQQKFGFFQSEKAKFSEIADFFSFPRLSEETDLAFARSPLAFLVEAADDICYTIIDVEDGVRLGILPFDEAASLLLPLMDAKSSKSFQERCHQMSDDTQRMGYLRAKIINILTLQCRDCFLEHLEEIEAGTFCDSLLVKSPAAEYIDKLKELEANKLYCYKPVSEIETAGFEIIHGLLEIILELQGNPENRRNRQRSLLFPKDTVCPDAQLTSYEKLLCATDFVSKLTDAAAINLFNKIRGVSFPKIY